MTREEIEDARWLAAQLKENGARHDQEIGAILESVTGLRQDKAVL